MRVLVTGASGFIGGFVCAELLRHEHQVVALVRRPGSQPAGTTAVLGDLSTADGLNGVFDSTSVDCVIHLAAEIATQRSAAKINATNINGMRRLIDACEKHLVERFVFTSTVVTGEANGAVLTEDSPLPIHTEYGRSKQAGETMLRESKLASLIIRPGHVYGPGGWYENEIVKRLKQPGRFVVIGSGRNWRDMVHVDDVASALVAAAERGQANEIYHCADDQPITQDDFVALTARALGVGAPRHVPLWLARLAVGRDTTLSIARSAKTSNKKLKRELGWSPKFAAVEFGVPAALATLSDR